MKFKPQVGLAASVFALAGCTTTPMLTSYPAGAAGPGEKYELVGQYGLAKSYIQVTLSSPSAGEKKDAATPPQVAFTSSISVTANDQPPPKPPEPKAEPKVETQASVCADIRKTYNQDRVSVLASYKRYSDFIAEVVTWEGHKPATTELEGAKARLDAFLLQRAKDAAASNRLGNLAPLIEECPQPVSIDMKELQVVDQDNIFRLYANKPTMADNNITIEMTGGYLKTVNATAEDRTADIVTEASTMLGTLSVIGKKVPVTQPRKGISISLVGGRDYLKDLVEAVRKSDFATADVSALRAALEAILPTLPKASDADPIDVELPMTIIVDLDTPVTVPDLGFSIRPVCSAAYKDTSLRTGAATALNSHDGIYVSGQRSCEIKAVRTIAGVERELGVVRFVAVDSDAATVLDVPRQSFTKTTSIYTFDNGRLVKSETVRPSQFVTALSLPGRALGGLVSGITGAQDDRKSIAESETERVKAETEKLKATQDYEKQKAEMADNPPPGDNQ